VGDTIGRKWPAVQCRLHEDNGHFPTGTGRDKNGMGTSRAL
jgi:hypothetical protein